MIEPGDTAPDFELPDQDGQTVKLLADEDTQWPTATPRSPT